MTHGRQTQGPSSARKPVVLLTFGPLWPGHEAAGPVQSLDALCTALGGAYGFRILARDRPYGAAAASVQGGHWRKRSGGHVRYCRPTALGVASLLATIRETPHDVLHLNSFFDRDFTIPILLMRRAGLLPRRPLVLSPRGELADGALSLKPRRKLAYRHFARACRLFDDVWLHATSPAELADIRRCSPCAVGHLMAANIRTLPPAPEYALVATEVRDRPLRLMFLGRITPVKNLCYAIEALAGVRHAIEYNIFGPLSDAAYWKHCQDLIARLPPHVRVHQRGELAHADVTATLAGQDLLFMPTLGENFGHAIADALAAGVPVLISDRTPWRDLERQEAGWDLALGSRAAFAAAIDGIAGMSDGERTRLRLGARRLAERSVREDDAVTATRRMYETVMAAHQVAARVALRSAPA